MVKDKNLRELDGFLRYVEDFYSSFINGERDFDEWRFVLDTPAAPLGEKDWVPDGESVEVWGCTDALDGIPLVYVKHSKEGGDGFHLWELSLRRDIDVCEPIGHRDPAFKWLCTKVDFGDWDSIIEDQLEEFIWERWPVILL